MMLHKVVNGISNGVLQTSHNPLTTFLIVVLAHWECPSKHVGWGKAVGHAYLLRPNYKCNLWNCGKRKSLLLPIFTLFSTEATLGSVLGSFCLPSSWLLLLSPNPFSLFRSTCDGNDRCQLWGVQEKKPRAGVLARVSPCSMEMEQDGMGSQDSYSIPYSCLLSSVNFSSRLEKVNLDSNKC